MKQHPEKSDEKEQKPKQEALPLKKRILIGIGLPAWVLVGFLAASLLLSGGIQLLFSIGILLPGSINESIFNATFAALAYTLTLLIVVGLPYKLKGIKTTKEELGLTRLPDWMDILLTPASFIVYLLFAGLLTLAVSELVPGFDAEEVQEVGFDSITRYYEYALAFITLVVVAPIAEEVLVRGYLYGKLRKIMPVIVAMLISSLLFSLMHFQWNVAINVLPLAIIMVLLREITGSIWAGILLHMLKNGVAFYLLFINPSILNTIGV